MASWDVIDSRTEYENEWYRGGYDLVEQPDGSTKRYYWVRLPPAVVIVAVTGEEIVFVEQYRPTVRELHLELPAGVVEDDESYEAAAGRELAEETGYRAGTLTLLQEYWVATGVLRHRRGVVYASDLTLREPDPGSDEFLRVRTIPARLALDRTRRPPTNDSTLTALYLARDHGYLS